MSSPGGKSLVWGVGKLTFISLVLLASARSAILVLRKTAPKQEPKVRKVCLKMSCDDGNYDLLLCPSNSSGIKWHYTNYNRVISMNGNDYFTVLASAESADDDSLLLGLVDQNGFDQLLRNVNAINSADTTLAIYIAPRNWVIFDRVGCRA